MDDDVSSILLRFMGVSVGLCIIVAMSICILIDNTLVRIIFIVLSIVFVVIMLKNCMSYFPKGFYTKNNLELFFRDEEMSFTDVSMFISRNKDIINEVSIYEKQSGKLCINDSTKCHASYKLVDDNKYDIFIWLL